MIPINRIILIGNLTRDPELKSTKEGIQVCSFTIAVSRKGKDNEADFIRCTAWRQLADLCAKYLSKGKKVCVVGSVSASAYIDKDGKPRASLECTADEIEFLSPKEQAYEPTQREQDERQGFVPVDEILPF